MAGALAVGAAMAAVEPTDATPSDETGPAAAPRWRATVAYLGTAFAGWQSQPGGEAVQDVIERVLASILDRPIRIHGASRTDAGVHARGQVFHFDAHWRHPPERLRAALRSRLPRSIHIHALAPARADFHARYSAVGKRYRYLVGGGEVGPFEHDRVWEIGRALDLAAMRAAAEVFVGRHDFRAFSAEAEAGPEDTTKELWRCRVVAGAARTVRLDFEGSGFLYRMVRTLVGGLVAAGLGRTTTAELSALLAGRVRTAAVVTAPAHGLCLERVWYRRPAVAGGDPGPP